MAGALAAIAASIHPQKWEKTTSASDNVLSFERWILEYERWESICTGGLGHNITQRWNLLLSVGGRQLEDIILHQANIVIADIQRRDPVVFQAEQQEMRDANDQIIQPYRAEVRAVPGRNGVTATTWEAGIEEIKKAIGKYSNSVMDRYKLMFKMPASDYEDWRKWGQELLE